MPLALLENQRGIVLPSICRSGTVCVRPALRETSGVGHGAAQELQAVCGLKARAMPFMQ